MNFLKKKQHNDNTTDVDVYHHAHAKKKQGALNMRDELVAAVAEFVGASRHSARLSFVDVALTSSPFLPPPPSHSLCLPLPPLSTGTTLFIFFATSGTQYAPLSPVVLDLH